MKNLKTILTVLALPAVLLSCKKKDQGPALTSRLIKQIGTTYANGSRAVIDYNYDSQGRLVQGGLNNNQNTSIIYNAGGISEKVAISNFTGDMEASLSGGSLATVSYKRQIGQSMETYASVFSYDTKGRLIRIAAKQLDLDPSQPYNRTYTYTWDDNDNLIQAKMETSQHPNGAIDNSYTYVYSGFSEENINTLTGTNFGFNYFGTASYPGNFTPSTSGDTQTYLPPVRAGKLLPSTVVTNGVTTHLTYHKNADGLIDHIAETGPTADYNVAYDIVYQ